MKVPAEVEAWVKFDEQGRPVAIINEMTEQQFNSWYSRQIAAGVAPVRCRITVLNLKK